MSNDKPTKRSPQAMDDPLDRALLQFTAPEPSPGLRRRLLADFAAHRASPSWRESFWRQLGGARFAMPAMAVAMALGIAVGSWLPSDTTNAGDIASDDALALLQYDLGEEGQW